MDENNVFDQQRDGLLIHRIIYLACAFYLLLLNMNGIKRTMFMFIVVIITAILEEILCKASFFKSVFILKCFRYTEIVITSLIVSMADNKSHSTLVAFAILVMLLIDFYLIVDITDTYNIVISLIFLGIPFAIIIVKEFIQNDNDIFFCIASLGLLILVLAKSVWEFSGFIKRFRSNYNNQVVLNNEIEKTNQNLMDYQNKIQKVNEQLNYQKIALEKAYREINQINSEMTKQSEILKYVVSSFDVPKITSFICDSIIEVKSPIFCGIYISKGTYSNKFPNYTIKSSMQSLSLSIKKDLDDIYSDYSASNKGIMIVKNLDKSRYAYLLELQVKSILIMPLMLDDKLYGIAMIGDRKDDSFVDDSSFYDVTFGQFNIAINNSKMYRKMENIARKDGLTGIYNRTYFNQKFLEHIEKAKLNKECISVALCDIDFFKKVNDTYGHLAGDEVIKMVAKNAEKVFEEYGGFVCRYGGEEFVGVLPGKNVEVALTIVQEFYDNVVSDNVVFDGQEISINVSVGLTAYPETCGNVYELLRRADWSMYYSKEHGRGRITVDNEDIHMV